jgi:ribose transport system substrate-binding protein
MSETEVRNVKIPRWQVLLAVLALGAVALAAAASLAAAGSKGPNLGYVRAQIEKYSALPKFVPPGPPVPIAKVKGKTVFNIPDSSSNPFANNIAKAMQKAAPMLGLEFIDFTNQGQPAQWVQGVYQAINRKVDLIDDFGGVNPKVIGPQITAAQKAGIKVVGTHLYDKTQKPLFVDVNVPAPYGPAARLIADWVILDTQGKADVLVVTSNEVLGTPPIVNGLKSEFAKYCGGGCKLQFLNAPVSDWATKIQSNVQSTLLRDPNINYIVPIYDSMAQFIVPAIRATNKIGKVHIATYNGTPFVLGYMQQADIVRMNVGENLDWLAWAYLDADARVLAGMKVPKVIDEHTALRVFTRENVKEAGTPPKISTGYGDAYVAGYKKLWGVN